MWRWLLFFCVLKGGAYQSPQIGTDLGDSSMQMRANSLWPVSLVVHESFVEQNGVFGPLDFLNYKYYIFMEHSNNL